MKSKTIRTPVRCSLYPSAREVTKVAAYAFMDYAHSGRDARGNEFEDVQQELHLKACEVLFQNRGAPLKLVYASMWNRARNMRALSRTAALHTDTNVDPSDDRYYPTTDEEARLEDRSCLRRLEKALSPTHMDTLHRLALKEPGQNIVELGLSHEGWRKRKLTARAAAAAALS